MHPTVHWTVSHTCKLTWEGTLTLLASKQGALLISGINPEIRSILNQDHFYSINGTVKYYAIPYNTGQFDNWTGRPGELWSYGNVYLAGSFDRFDTNHNFNGHLVNSHCGANYNCGPMYFFPQE